MKKEPLESENDDFISAREFLKRERNYAHDAKKMAKNARKQKAFSGFRKFLSGLLNSN